MGWLGIEIFQTDSIGQLLISVYAAVSLPATRRLVANNRFSRCQGDGGLSVGRCWIGQGET